MHGEANVSLPSLLIDFIMPSLQRLEYADEREEYADVAHADQDVREEPCAKGIVLICHDLEVDTPVDYARNRHGYEGGEVEKQRKCPTMTLSEPFH